MQNNYRYLISTRFQMQLLSVMLVGIICYCIWFFFFSLLPGSPPRSAATTGNPAPPFPGKDSSLLLFLQFQHLPDAADSDRLAGFKKYLAGTDGPTARSLKIRIKLYCRLTLSNLNDYMKDPTQGCAYKWSGKTSDYYSRLYHDVGDRVCPGTETIRKTACVDKTLTGKSGNNLSGTDKDKVFAAREKFYWNWYNYFFQEDYGDASL